MMTEPSFSRPFGLRVVDHLLGNAVLDRTGGVEVFQLGKMWAGSSCSFFNVGQLQQRSMTDQLICGSIDLAHCSFLPDTKLWAHVAPGRPDSKTFIPTLFVGLMAL